MIRVHVWLGGIDKNVETLVLEEDKKIYRVSDFK